MRQSMLTTEQAQPRVEEKQTLSILLLQLAELQILIVVVGQFNAAFGRRACQHN